MKKISIFVITIILIGISQDTLAQGEGSSSNLEYSMTTEESIMLFGGFAVAVIGIFLFLERDSILRRKTSYDKEEQKRARRLVCRELDIGDRRRGVELSNHNELPHLTRENGKLQICRGD